MNKIEIKKQYKRFVKQYMSNLIEEKRSSDHIKQPYSALKILSKVSNKEEFFLNTCKIEVKNLEPRSIESQISQNKKYA